MKKMFIASMVFLSYYTVVKAQKSNSEKYFVTKTDTIFCKELQFSTGMQGYLKEVIYTDMQGKKEEIKEFKRLLEIQTFYINGEFTDQTPLKANKPDGYVRYTKRAVDGKLKVYLAQQGSITTTQYTMGSVKGDGFNTSSGPSGIYRFYLKIPDGTYYQINNKGNMKKYIKPYLLKCKDFEKNYKGDFSTREEPFMEMIKLYNLLCD